MRCPKSTKRDGLDFISFARSCLTSTSGAPFAASELIEIAMGKPSSVATLGATVFFPVPGVPHMPIILRTSARSRRGVKTLLKPRCAPSSSFEHLEVRLPELRDLGSDDEEAIGLQRVLPVVVLVVVLCSVESLEGL